ncbi:MAG: MazG family protein [Chloroflexi bacterium]|nr:MAG: MazG family protein [Chloroflexota bacterium]
MKYRHPHVWGDWNVADSEEVVLNWEMLKEKEKGDNGPVSLLDNIPVSMPALARSQKIQRRVKKVGFDWPDISGVYGKLAEEIGELKAAKTPAEQMAEFGDILFAAVNVARWLDVDAESALREANLRFGRRFRRVEQLAKERGLDLSEMDLDGLEAIWQEVKRELND